MKKILVTVYLCLIAVYIYAVVPLADVDTVEFSGDATAGFGVDLDTSKTGFLNETNVLFQMNFLPTEMTTSTFGYGLGVWGELVLKLDGDFMYEVDAPSESVPLLINDTLIVDKAIIHIYDGFVGVETGDFDFGDDFNYPNALGFDNEETLNGGGIYYKEDDPSARFGYYQGLTAGYEHDMFTVEASVRTQREYTPDSFTYIATGENPSTTESLLIPYEEGMIYTNSAEVPYPVINGNWVIPPNTIDPVTGELTEGYRVYNVDDESALNYTNKYAVGLYSSITPIEDLLIGVGGAYAITGTKIGDFSVFAGTQYLADLGMFSLLPVVTYNLFGDLDESTNILSITENILGFGINFGWGEATEGDSLLYDFYEYKLAYVGTPDSDVDDEGDGMLLPGVSLFTSIDFLPDALINTLPFLFMVHSGDIIPNLNGQILFSTNFAVGSNEVLWDEGQSTAEKAMDGALNKLASQVGLAVDYDIPTGDITITPAVGVLFGYTASKKESDTTFGTSLLPVVNVKLAGLVPNTIFELEWNEFDFSTGTETVAGVTKSIQSLQAGVITVKAEIAL